MAQLSCTCIVFSFIIGSKGGALFRVVRETPPPPCSYTIEQCSTTTNPPVTNSYMIESIRNIEDKIRGAEHIAEDTIKIDIEERWPIVVVEPEYITVATENGTELYMGDASFCNKTHNVYESLNELANYIDFLLHQEGGVLNSILEAHLKENFSKWQDEIYLCMCEMKLFLRSLNCDPCSSVPSGHLPYYFQTSNFIFQQEAVYWVVLTGINRLQSIQTYLQLAKQDF